MYKKNIAIICLISLLISTLSACLDAKTNQSSSEFKEENVDEKAISNTISYYSITNAHVDHYKNDYIEVDIKIPRIKYSNLESDLLFDDINKEIYDNSKKMINESISKAKETFELYLKSARENILSDKENQLKNLIIEYQDILGEKEAKIVNKVLSDIKNESTPSEIEVFGFAVTEAPIIIDPALHNKNIIIIDSENDETKINKTFEGTKSEITKETKHQKKEFKENKSTPSHIIEQPEIVETKSTISQITLQQKIEPQKVTSTTSNTTKKVLNIKDFNDEIERISQIEVPSIESLTKDYIPTYIYFDFDVKCLDNNYISLLLTLYESRTLTSTKLAYYNIDLNNHKILKINDVLGDNYKELCINNIKSQIENWDSEMKSFLPDNLNIEKYINDDVSFFINNNQTPVIVLNNISPTFDSDEYPEFPIIYTKEKKKDQ